MSISWNSGSAVMRNSNAGRRSRRRRNRSRRRFALWPIGLLGLFGTFAILLVFGGEEVFQGSDKVADAIPQVKPTLQEWSDRTGEREERTVAAMLAGTDEDAIEIEQATHAAVNAARVKGGLHPLAWDDGLALVALKHSRDMARRGYFAHDTPEGLDPTDRLRREGLSCRKGLRYGIAENLAKESIYNVAPEDVGRKAAEAWINSPAHMRNLLSAEYKTTGIGAALAGGTVGTVYLTQVFC